jgi:hypothetical protein
VNLCRADLSILNVIGYVLSGTGRGRTDALHLPPSRPLT